jgi:hypothetical protein
MLFWVHRRSRAPRGPNLGLRQSDRQIDCEVIPRSDASPQELKRLAQVLGGWIERNAMPSVTTAYALADLRQGELPQPLSVALELYLDDSLSQRGLAPPTGPQRALRHHQVLEKLGKMAMSRSVFLHVAEGREAGISLREAIPPDLVQDILIDRRSWDAQ